MMSNEWYRLSRDNLLNRKQPINTIVLDLDETLLSTTDDCRALTKLGVFDDPQYSDIRDRCYVITFFNHRSMTESVYCGIARPHLREFLEYLRNNFQVIVFTAGDNEYAPAAVEQIFHFKPRYIFSNRDCLHDGDNFSKPLSRLLELKPRLGESTQVEHMLMVDDRRENLEPNLEQGYLIPRYEPEYTIEGLRMEDDELLKLIDLLKQHK